MKLWSKLRALFSRSRLEREMAEEMQAHLDGLTERNIAAGMSPEEARYAARRAFGGVEQIKERARDVRGCALVDGFWGDLRFSVRSFWRTKIFSFAVIATLALCIWANTAVLAVLYGLVLKPLPFHDAGQIVDVYNMRPKAGQMHQKVGVVQYLDYRANADLFEAFALWSGWMFNIGEESGASRHVGMRITPDYFKVLGLQPLLGSFFTEEACRPGQDAVVVLTQSYWEKHFKADPDIVGKEVRLSGRPHTIVGVVPQRFEELSVAPLLMVPWVWDPERVQPNWRAAPMADMYARIKPGVDHGMARAQLDTLEQRFRESVADPALRDFLASGGHRMGLRQLRAQQTEPIKNGLIMLQGGALLVLLLGCVNVASLMLARANTRQAEFAVRQALGAGRGVLARQLFTEAALLALVGGAFGVALATASLKAINIYTDKAIYGIPPVRLDGSLLGLTLVVSLGVALLIGLLPVLRIWRAGSLQGAIQSGTRAASRNGGIRAMSGSLVVAQVALALMLLIGAGLLMRSFAKVMAINPGFEVSKVIHVRAAYDAGFNDPDKLKVLQDRILEKMREIPGIESVACSDRLPGFGEDRPATLPLWGTPPGQDGVYPTAVVMGVSPEYFPTMGIRLLEGRNFTEADRVPNARPVVIVDRKFAERHFQGKSVVGQLLAWGRPDQKPEDAPIIVGVAEVARVGGLETGTDTPYAYLAMGTSRGGLSVLLRTSRAFKEVMPVIRAQLRRVDASLPIYQEQTMQMWLDDKMAGRRGMLWLLGAFAGIALVLAAVGIYGMLAYDVTQRTKEIGIRGAIGATQDQIVMLILQQGVLKAGFGLLIGLAGAFYLSRYLSSLLYEVEATDPLVFTGVTLLLILVALLASWLPARRAAKVDPMVALRSE
ncbi:MAG: ABC transporter permease [Opitutaceae bacterium]|nr:ABC transporter permease [Opitutaceae bacterium]